MTRFLHLNKLKRLLFIYWLVLPLIFGAYLLSLAAVKSISVITIISSLPGLALTTIVALCLYFQLFGLYLLKNTSKYRGSLLGTYLKFSMLQQLCSLNIPGVILCGLFYYSLAEGREPFSLSKQIYWLSYLLMTFVGLMTLLVLWIRLTL